MDFNFQNYLRKQSTNDDILYNKYLEEREKMTLKYNKYGIIDNCFHKFNTKKDKNKKNKQKNKNNNDDLSMNLKCKNCEEMNLRIKNLECIIKDLTNKNINKDSIYLLEKENAKFKLKMKEFENTNILVKNLLNEIEMHKDKILFLEKDKYLLTKNYYEINELISKKINNGLSNNNYYTILLLQSKYIENNIIQKLKPEDKKKIYFKKNNDKHDKLIKLENFSLNKTLI